MFKLRWTLIVTFGYRMGSCEGSGSIIAELVSNKEPEGYLQGLYARAAFPRVHFSELYASAPYPNLAFVHVPKTGGETFEQAFGLVKSHDRAYKRTDLDGPDVLSFAVVRNPFDRAFSWFKFCLAGWHSYEIVPNPRPQCLLARELAALQDTYAAFNSWVQVVFGTKGTQGQHMWITNTFSDYIMDIPKDKMLVDVVLPFECFAESVQFLAQLTGRVGNVTVHHENSSTTNTTDHIKNYVEYYDHASRAIIEDHYKQDLILFQYVFGQTTRC